MPGTILHVVLGYNHTLVLTNHGLYACFTPLSELRAELKHWFSILRRINHLITISTSDAEREQEYGDEFRPLLSRQDSDK